ncbi:hypothetical protein L1887_53514 [Cichorium endivia]|nr:hypothetical protein L1887_53514 [Cichorium endivia]
MKRSCAPYARTVAIPLSTSEKDWKMGDRVTDSRRRKSRAAEMYETDVRKDARGGEEQEETDVAEQRRVDRLDILGEAVQDCVLLAFGRRSA